MADLRDNQIQELIEYLTGTCYSLNEVCHILFDCAEDVLTSAQQQEIDQQIFRCETCAWWDERGAEAENANGDELCEQCAE